MGFQLPILSFTAAFNAALRVSEAALQLLFLLTQVLAQQPLLLGGQDRLTFGLAVGLQLVETLLKILDLRVVLRLNLVDPFFCWSVSPRSAYPEGTRCVGSGGDDLAVDFDVLVLSVGAGASALLEGDSVVGLRLRGTALLGAKLGADGHE